MPSDQPPPSPNDSTFHSKPTEKYFSPDIDLQVGRYHLLERIGEGGMGEVYIAEQREPYYRKVAVKLIRPDVLGSIGVNKYVARFEAERQALALMDHPNIAKVIDGGATPNAGPYIVMELCLGKTLDKYLRDNQLDLRQRLALFLQVCQAVEHAHQKGILHRDLKPSNIIVQEVNNSPTVKVIDFGLAKALQPALRLTDKTLHTRHGVFLGTFKYTSPEQAATKNDDIDTRSDIYTLGIILFELLTDTTPLDDDFISSNDPTEILRVVREVDAPRPSSVSGSRNRSKTADTSVLRRNVAAIRNELDWITLKAIQKERHLRYQSVTALADDIKNFLNNEPISARPPSQIYRLRKFASRNRALVSVVASAFFGLAAVALGIAVAYLQSVDSQKKINASLKVAEESSKVANEANERLGLELALNRENTLKAAETAKISGINAWSRGERMAAIDSFIESLYLKPDDKATSAWLYSILADKTSFPIDAPDIVFGGTQEIKRALLSRDGTGILAQHADNTLRAYNVDRMMRFGIEKSQQGAAFKLEDVDFIFDMFRNKKANALYILAGTTPTATTPPILTVWSFNGKIAKRLSSYKPNTQFYTEPFFGPTGEWYVARGGNDLSNKNRTTYSLVNSENGQLIQEFEGVESADAFAISPDGSQIITTGIPVVQALEKSEVASYVNEGVTNTDAILFDLESKSISRIPLASTASKVGFTPIGGNYIETQQVMATTPRVVDREEIYTVTVPVNVEVMETYTVQVPVTEKSEDGKEVTVLKKEERTRTKTVVELREETRTRTVQATEYVTQVYDVQVQHIDKTQTPLPYVSVGSETFYYTPEGKLSHSLPSYTEEVHQKLHRLTSAAYSQSSPYQLQFFPAINSVGIRNAGDFELIRIPSSDDLQEEWPAIPLASFPASPFAETHLQPKFSATVNETNDSIAIPVSANAIHIYRLSTNLPPLPPPLLPTSSATHSHVHSTVSSETWVATSNNDEKNKIVLMEIRPKNVPIPLTLELETQLERYGSFFIDRPKKRLLVSDYIPPTRSGFCVECGAPGANVAPQVKVDASGTPRSASLGTNPQEPSDEFSVVDEDRSESSQEGGEKSLLVDGEAEPPQSDASATSDKSLQEDLYRDFPVARFSVVSFPDGKVLADKVPGILSAITEKNSVVLVRNFNRLYFYDTEALTWFKGWLQFDAEVTSCCYSPDGTLFSVGTKSGLTIWYDSNSFAELGRFQFDDEIVELEFDSNNKYLAVQTSNYLSLPNGVDSNSFSLLTLANAQKIYSSQSSVQFQGFSPDGTKVLVQSQLSDEESFSVMELPSLKLIVPITSPPYASYGLDVSFANDDLIVVTERNESWLFSCRWQVPVSPRFTHPDIDRASYYRPRVASIDNPHTVTLVFDANSSIRGWQVELPVRDVEHSGFELHGAELTAVARTFLNESSPRFPANEDKDALAPTTTTNQDSKWQELIIWLTQRRKDKSPWPDLWLESSVRSFENELTRLKPRSASGNWPNGTLAPAPAAPSAQAVEPAPAPAPSPPLEPSPIP